MKSIRYSIETIPGCLEDRTLGGKLPFGWTYLIHIYCKDGEQTQFVQLQDFNHLQPIRDDARRDAETLMRTLTEFATKVEKVNWC